MVILLIKMRLLDQYIIGCRKAFSNAWCNSFLSGKALTETWLNLLLDERCFSLFIFKIDLFNLLVDLFRSRKLSVIAWVDYFVLQICWRSVEKKVFLKNFMDFNHLQTKIKLNILIINVKTKVFFLITMTLKLAKSEKAKKK